MEIGVSLRGGQGPSAVAYLAKLLATRTGLGLIQQLGLFDRQILDDLPRDGLANLAGSDFNASKRGFLPSEVVCFKIDAKFFGDSINRMLVFR